MLCSAYHLSKRDASNLYGISRLTERAEKVRDAIKIAADIKRKHSCAMKLEQEKYLLSQGIDPAEFLHDTLTSDLDYSSDCESELSDSGSESETQFIGCNIFDECEGNPNMYEEPVENNDKILGDRDVTSENKRGTNTNSSLAENVAKGETSCMQKYADEFSLKASVDGFQLNETKCKELRINFSNYPVQFEPITINGKEIEVVPSARVLGLKISSDLKWNPHIEDICKKVASRLYFLRQLKRAQLTAKDMLLFYITCIRPTIEYACQVFHTGLPQYLSDDLESLQKRALRIIYPDLSYNEALNALDLTTLFERRQILNDRLFKEIVEDSSHKLNNLLPSRNSCTANLRKRRLFQLPICKTNRFKNTFIPYNLYNSFIN